MTGSLLRGHAGFASIMAWKVLWHDRSHRRCGRQSIQVVASTGGRREPRSQVAIAAAGVLCAGKLGRAMRHFRESGARSRPDS